METQKAIINRRSVYPRQFTGAIIPETHLMLALEAANWAPSHKKTFPWRFYLYTDQGKNRLINQWIEMAKNTAIAKGEGWDEVKQGKFELMRRCSHIIAIGCVYSGLVPEVEETCAVAAAVQNFWLSLTQQGYAGYWSTGNGAFSSEMHTWLQLAENEKCLGYFLCGMPEGIIPGSGRKPITEFTKLYNQ